MPAKGAEYALLQRKYQFENILKTVASHRGRTREQENTCVCLIEMRWNSNVLMYSMGWSDSLYQRDNTTLSK